VLYTAQALIFLALYLLVLVMCVVALIDLARRPAQAFVSAGKRTKGFWGALLGVSAAVSFAALPPFRAPLGFLVLIAAVVAAVYLADVKPAVTPYSGRRGPGPGRSGW
jgi:hypothetical protein